MKYARVDRAHIIPQTYLRNFAKGDQIAMRLVGGRDKYLTTIGKAGVRNRFYSRSRPDGTRIDDVEWSLGVLEGAVTPLLRGIEDRWPLSLDEKADLAEFVAAQLFRGPDGAGITTSS